ncbi:DNA glycosylase [Entophlyctis helioformis]|nr:DNA glycosylase [Entophlyctis helioformis]
MRCWANLGALPAELRIDKVLVCGQAFRWVPLGANTWGGVLAQRLVALRQTDQDVLFRFAAADDFSEDDGRSLLWDYFQLDTSLASLYKIWSADANFASKVRLQGIDGLRVLRQDPLENVVSFICSSNNNISRISGMVNALCAEYGQQLDPSFLDDLDDLDVQTGGSPAGQETKRPAFYTFPDMDTLASDGVEERLRQLGFGYRAKYVAESAKFIQKQGGASWLLSLRQRSYEDAHKELLQLPGVGPKVADCICLMSLDKTGAIPVDTHVWQIAKRDYGFVGANRKSLTKSIYEEIGRSFRGVFGEHAGWAHTVLFCADLSKFQPAAAAAAAQSGQVLEPAWPATQPGETNAAVRGSARAKRAAASKRIK